METTLTGSLMEAWFDRWRNATETLIQAKKAPALFKPERVAELQQEAAVAEAIYRYWLAQDVAR